MRDHRKELAKCSRRVRQLALGKVMSHKVAEILNDRRAELTGRRMTPAEGAEITAQFQADILPPSLSDWLLSHSLIGTEFYLGEEDDESGLGVEMQWLTPQQMISEASEAYPGIAATPLGYLPVGSCLTGSGDYYYLKPHTGDDPTLVRIPHEAATADGELKVESIERVSTRLGEFLRNADIG